MRVIQNREALEDMPRLALRQVRDSRQNSNKTRKEIIARQNQEAQAGRLNATLPPDAWESMDGAVYQAAEDTLTIVQDLLNANLRYNVDLSAKHDTWGIIEDTGEANIGMTPEARDEESGIRAGEDGSPIPIIDDGFSIGFREEPLNSDRLPEDSLDTTKATVSSRHVSEAVEELFVDAENIQITGVNGEGYTLYGITDHPDTATGTTTSDWTVDGNEGDVRSDIREMRSILKNQRNYSPGATGYWVYMGQEYYDTLDDSDPEGTGDLTIMDRVENLSNIGMVKQADFLPDKSVMMFRPTEDVIEVGVGADIQAVQWEDPFRDHYRALVSMYPRIKRTFAPDTLSADYVNGFVYWTA